MEGCVCEKVGYLVYEHGGYRRITQQEHDGIEHDRAGHPQTALGVVKHPGHSGGAEGVGDQTRLGGWVGWERGRG